MNGNNKNEIRSLKKDNNQDGTIDYKDNIIGGSGGLAAIGGAAAGITKGALGFVKNILSRGSKGNKISRVSVDPALNKLNSKQLLSFYTNQARHFAKDLAKQLKK